MATSRRSSRLSWEGKGESGDERVRIRMASVEVRSAMIEGVDLRFLGPTPCEEGTGPVDVVSSSHEA